MLKDPLSVDENYTLNLFNNNHIITQDSVSADFTACIFTNYVAKTLTRANWNAATTISNEAVSEYSLPLDWTCGATGDTIYGYWVEGATSGITLWAERFGVARTITENSILKLTPKFSLNSKNTTS